jgi:ArsR family transcriptional regulator
MVAEIGPVRAEQLAEVLRALGHPLRLRIVSLLCRQELHVNTLAERLGVPQVTMSQQLRILRLTRLVDVTRTAGQARYRLAIPELRSLFDCLSRCSADGEAVR